MPSETYEKPIAMSHLNIAYVIHDFAFLKNSDKELNVILFKENFKTIKCKLLLIWRYTISTEKMHSVITILGNRQNVK